MAVSSLETIVAQLRQTMLSADDEVTDAHLLGQFVGQNDERAFEALIRRHGPMVLGVCRRLLGSVHDVEDAFQATFLVLVHKAASIQAREQFANWLYGVAYKTALAARAKIVRRRTTEKQVIDMPDSIVMPTEDGKELRHLIDQELYQLPEIYQKAIVLCDLEGRTRQEAARKLGIAEGTMSSRLTTGRRRLAKRLARHGLPISAGVGATLLAPSTSSACVAGPLVTSTVKVAATVAAGSAPVGAISANVVALTEGVLKTMPLTKTNPLAILVLACFLLTVIAFFGLAVAPIQPQPQPSTKAPAKWNDKKVIDQFQRQIMKYLAKLDPNAKMADVREDLSKIVDEFGQKLRPARGSKTYVSSDKSFVLVIAAKSVSSEGEEAKASDLDARIVMAVGGEGVPRVPNVSRAGHGGAAVAVAPKGVAIAIAGRGGLGGGGAGGTVALGGIGNLCLGRSGNGGGQGIVNANAIANVFGRTTGPATPLDPKRVVKLDKLARQVAAANNITAVLPQIFAAQNRPQPKQAPRIKGVPAVDQLQRKLTNYLGLFDPNAKFADVREDLYKIVGQFSGKLRPATGLKTYISSDRAFVLTIAANGVRSDGEDARVLAPRARIVMAVGGDGAPGESGGSASAVAPNGVGIGLAGRGGLGGGGGGGTNGQGGIGGLCLGGSGGAGVGLGGRGGDGGCRGVIDGEAIVKAFRKPLDPKTVARVNELVRQLGSASFRKREQATRALEKMGTAVTPLLRAALTSNDLEVRLRAKQILERLK